MQQITATARVFGADDKPAAGLGLRLEMFTLAGGWTALADARTDSEGAVSITARVEPPPQGAAHLLAPALRLLETDGDLQPRVLATGGVLAYGGARRPVLAVDFGQIERLEENRFPLVSTAGQPTDRQHTVAGLAHRPEISMAMLTRTLAERGSLTREATVNLGTRETVAADTASAPVSTDRFNAEIMGFMARETTLREDLAAKTVELAAAGTRLATMERAVADATARAITAEQEKAEAVEQAAALRSAASRETPLQAIAASIGKEAAAANTAMEAEAAGFRIAKLQVSLQGSMTPGGDSIALASVADAVKAPAVRGVYQNLVFDLIPDKRPAPPPAGTAVPDVLGLTESAARRALAAAGLSLSAASRPGGASGRFSVGQAIQQAPAAGQPAAPGETVIVVFAAP